MDSNNEAVQTSYFIYESLRNNDIDWQNDYLLNKVFINSYKDENPAHFKDEIIRLPDNPWFNIHDRQIDINDELPFDDLQILENNNAQIRIERADNNGNDFINNFLNYFR